MYCAFPIFEFNFSFFLKKYLVILPFFECQIEAFQMFLKIQEKYPVFLNISKCSFNNNLNFFHFMKLYLNLKSSSELLEWIITLLFLKALVYKVSHIICPHIHRPHAYSCTSLLQLILNLILLQIQWYQGFCCSLNRKKVVKKMVLQVSG